MNLIKLIYFGGSYREEWDEHYKLRIVYSDRQSRKLLFNNGIWQFERNSAPCDSFTNDYFQQAASAAVSAERFIASGQTAQDISELAPDHCKGAIFASECMRILMDEYGLRMETIYPYVAPCMGTALSDGEISSLHKLQPRTCCVLKLLNSLLMKMVPVRHDIRLNQYRDPVGSVCAGEMVRLSVHTRKDAFRSCTLELYGDQSSFEYSMDADELGWTVQFQAPKDPAAMWYRFRMQSDSETFWLCAASDGIHAWLREVAQEGFRFTVAVPGFDTPVWFRNSVMYQVFPDRFAFSDDETAKNGVRYHQQIGQTAELHMSLQDEVRWQARNFESNYIPDDFYGGTLQGIREKLPYLKDLGITCVYLNPIVEARSNHRYDTSDYLNVDPILGTNEDFVELCNSANQYGIRIICDGVFSHTGADSIYFNRDGHYPNPGACQKDASPFDSWYDFRHFPDDYRCWWGFKELPEVNENDPSWQEYIITGRDSVVRRWLQRGASGWRLDVADELPDQVLAMIRESAKEEKPDSVILGEVWEDAILKESYGTRRKYALGYALDSVMNYPFRTAVLDFLHGRTNAFDLADFLTSQQLHYPKPLYYSLMNLLGSHDVERLRTNLASGVNLKDYSREEQLEIERNVPEECWSQADRMERLAAAIQFSVPGVPSIYYGDEYGMTGTNDPFNRRPFVASDDTASGNSLREYIKFLSSQRLQNDAFLDGEAFFLADNPDVLLILRSGKKSVLTVVNRAETTQSYSLYTQEYKVTGQIQPFSALFFPL